MGDNASTSTVTRRQPEHQRRRQDLRSRGQSHAWAVFGVVFAATLMRGVGTPFEYDSRYYWDAAMTLVTGGGTPSADPKFYDLRGVLTGATFTPAAAAAAIGGDTVAGVAVLVQNAALVAALAAFLLPALVRPWRGLTAKGRWVLAGLTWLALQGFAPFPMADMYAVAAVLLALVLLARRRPWALVGAGIAIGYALNVRPAYLPAVAFLAVTVAFSHRLRALWVVPGVALALLPQVIYTFAVAGRFSPAPPGGDRLVSLQAGYASYVVRYDTYVWSDLNPRQFFCSPSMATAVDELPTSTGDLLLTFVKHLPTSALFSLEKVAAALHWPWAIPYASSNPGVNALFAAAITLATVVGCAYLLAVPFARRRALPTGLGAATARVLAVGVGAVVMLVGSATEARFALPLVLLGVCGVAALSDEDDAVVRRRRFMVLAVGAAVVVLALGYAGLAHPAFAGGANQQTCAAT